MGTKEHHCKLNRVQEPAYQSIRYRLIKNWISKFKKTEKSKISAIFDQIGINWLEMCQTIMFQARRLRHFSARSQSITNQQRLQIVQDQVSISSTCLCAAFTQAGPKSAKSCLIWLSFFELLGSAHVKIAHKMMVKLTPEFLEQQKWGRTTTTYQQRRDE